MSNILSKIMDGIQFIAPTVANLVVPGSGPLLHTIMRTVTGDDENADIEQVARKIDQNPELFLQVQNQAMAHELAMAKVEAAKLETVNKTMRAESKSEHWPQWSWRPFNGFLYPLAIIWIYAILPLSDVTIPKVPLEVWLLWGSILGIATVGRNKQKKIAAGDASPGLFANAIKAIRGQ